MSVPYNSLINAIIHAWLYGNLINVVTGQIGATAAALPPTPMSGLRAAANPP